MINLWIKKLFYDSWREIAIKIQEKTLFVYKDAFNLKLITTHNDYTFDDTNLNQQIYISLYFYTRPGLFWFEQLRIFFCTVAQH